MKHALKLDDWRLTEDGWAPDRSLAAERFFGLSSPAQGVRAHFEEYFSGQTRRFSTVEGADEAFFGADWLAIDVEIDGKKLDLADSLVSDFRRSIDLREGWAERTCTVTTRAGKILKIYAKRFLSLAEPEIGAMRFAIVPMNFSGRLSLEPSVALGEPFWQPVLQEIELENAVIAARSAENEAQLAAAMRFTIYQDGEEIDFETVAIGSPGRVGCRAVVDVEQMQATIVFKYAAQILDEKGRKDPDSLAAGAKKAVTRAFKKGFSKLIKEQAESWAAFWSLADVEIEGDRAAQAEARLGLFKLAQKQSKAAFVLPFSTFLLTKSPAEAATMLVAQTRRAADLDEKSRAAVALDRFFRWTGREVFSAEKAMAFWLDLARGWATRLGLGADFEGQEMGKKSLELAAQHLARHKKADPEAFKNFLISQKFEEKKETTAWRTAIEKAKSLELKYDFSPASLADFWRELVGTERAEWGSKTAEPINEQAIRGSFELLFEQILGIAPDGERLAFSPKLPEEWASVSLKIWFRGSLLSAKLSNKNVEIRLLDGLGCWLSAFGKSKKLAVGSPVRLEKAA